MPLTRAQAEDFVHEFFKDHRLPAPAVATRKRFLVTTAPRKRLNLPRTITREALADQVAAQLCRRIDKTLVLGTYPQSTIGLPVLLPHTSDMENLSEPPNGAEGRQESERLKEILAMRNRRANEWRKAADRMETAGLPGTALLFRNEAYRIEQESQP